MNVETGRNANRPPDHPGADSNQVVVDREDRLGQAVGEFVAAIEAGKPADPSALLAKYSDVAEELAACIEAFDFIQHVAPQLAEPSASGERKTSTTLSPLATLGDFRINREIGRGGMGVVYEAEQLSIGRRVALKVLPFAAMLDQQQLNRFKNEARAAGTLDHPNLVSVFSVGVERGVHYYAMQLIDGQSLAELIVELRDSQGKAIDEADGHAIDPAANSSGASLAKVAQSPSEQPPSESLASPSADTKREPQAALSTLPEADTQEHFRSVARLGIQAAEALDHAHQNGIVHRDVKPGNLLVNNAGELWVTDFGLARIETDASMTMSGDLLGTLRYMSPEQALAKRAVVDHRTDIYSLGVTLYELLTLEPAFKGHDRQQLLSAIATDEPLVLRRINPAIPADLETVILKAIQKEPEARYTTAQDLADDLTRFLDGKPIEAKRPTPVQRLVKWSRRHRAVVTTAITTLLVTLSISTAIIARAYQAERSQRHIAEQEKARAVENFSVALEAVDELYAQFHEWLAADTYVSMLQQRFMNKALGIYKQLLEQQGEDEHSKHFVSTTYSKMARIHARMRQYSEARTALERAAALSEQLMAQAPDKRQYRDEVADSYNNLSIALRHLGLGQEALKALEKARHHTVELTRKFPNVLDYQKDLAVNDQYRAATLHSIGRLDKAERLARGAKQRWSELANEDSSLYTRLNVIRSEALLANVLMDQGQLNDALDLAVMAQRRYNVLRPDHGDHRGVARVGTDLAELLGQINYAAARPEEAAKQFRETLDLQRRLLKARVKPVQFELAVTLKKQFHDDEYEEPELFCSYVETQLRLAAALRQLHKPYETEIVLGEAVKVSQILADTDPGVLRYLAARANSCADLAVLLQDRRPDESALALKMAAAIWHDTVAQCANAADFRSGVRGQQNDLHWFVAKYPKQRIGDQAPKLKSVRLGGESVFSNHTMGVMFYEGELWKMAITRFTKSAELRRDRHAFDWYYLAMAHWKLDEQEEARRWFEKAQQWTEEHMKDDEELGRLREQAAALLALTEEVP